jgi:hypothetical protein
MEVKEPFWFLFNDCLIESVEYFEGNKAEKWREHEEEIKALYLIYAYTFFVCLFGMCEEQNCDILIKYELLI